jgi:hypothetical protein
MPVPPSLCIFDTANFIGLQNHLNHMLDELTNLRLARPVAHIIAKPLQPELNLPGYGLAFAVHFHHATPTTMTAVLAVSSSLGDESTEEDEAGFFEMRRRLPYVFRLLLKSLPRNPPIQSTNNNLKKALNQLPSLLA